VEAGREKEERVRREQEAAQLRKAFEDAEADIDKIVADAAQFKLLWDEAESVYGNGSGAVDYREAGAFLQKKWACLNNKTALKRAFRWATTKDEDGDDKMLDKKEFERFLRGSAYFNRVYGMVEQAPEGSLREEEFKAAVAALGVTEKDLGKAFATVDGEGNESATFSDFADWYAGVRDGGS
jgi:hypothetical protein